MRVTSAAFCQVEGCEENLEHAKAYNKRHHVCWVHSRAWEVLIHGVLSRFCQQCSRCATRP